VKEIRDGGRKGKIEMAQDQIPQLRSIRAE
jgi:hypothetical protein